MSNLNKSKLRLDYNKAISKNQTRFKNKIEAGNVQI